MSNKLKEVLAKQWGKIVETKLMAIGKRFQKLSKHVFKKMHELNLFSAKEHFIKICYNMCEWDVIWCTQNVIFHKSLSSKWVLQKLRQEQIKNFGDVWTEKW